MLSLVIDQRYQTYGDYVWGRVLPAAERTMVGPFIFFDHMGPAGVGRELDIPPHPHIGLAAITYVFDGEIIHRDSVGSEQPIREGEVNWMTAGRGIVHSERYPTANGERGRIHCIQGWVALPDRQEEVEPSFFHHSCGELPTMEEGGVWTRLVAGDAYGIKSPVKTHSPLFFGHHVLEAGAEVQLPPTYEERAIYVLSGAVEANGVAFGKRRMLVFNKGADAVVRATEPTFLVSLGGDPVGPRFVEWNFVSSSRDRIQQAKADWRAGRMKLPELDDKQFIPLPDEPEASLPPM
jgi:redox-sensitive bicupin YhaK (pirin superfamily)